MTDYMYSAQWHNTRLYGSLHWQRSKWHHQGKLMFPRLPGSILGPKGITFRPFMSVHFGWKNKNIAYMLCHFSLCLTSMSNYSHGAHLLIKWGYVKFGKQRGFSWPSQCFLVFSFFLHIKPYTVTAFMLVWMPSVPTVLKHTFTRFKPLGLSY